MNPMEQMEYGYLVWRHVAERTDNHYAIVACNMFYDAITLLKT